VRTDVRILALDTATEACSVALLTEGGVIGRFEEVGRGHAERILAMVDATLAEAGFGLAMLDAIAASVGPGAFTGVRISVSVAQGLEAHGPLVLSPADAVTVPFAGSYDGIGRGFQAHPTLAALAGLRLAAGAAHALPDARYMAELGGIRWRAGQVVDPADLAPKYLRDKVALTEIERAAARGAS
jgi:tRNA A37 threonylcarbamoyladenosine modification protein TsaB